MMVAPVDAKHAGLAGSVEFSRGVANLLPGRRPIVAFRRIHVYKVASQIQQDDIESFLSMPF